MPFDDLQSSAFSYLRSSRDRHRRDIFLVVCSRESPSDWSRAFSNCSVSRIRADRSETKTTKAEASVSSFRLWPFRLREISRDVSRWALPWRRRSNRQWLCVCREYCEQPSNNGTTNNIDPKTNHRRDEDSKRKEKKRKKSLSFFFLLSQRGHRTRSSMPIDQLISFAYLSTSRRKQTSLSWRKSRISVADFKREREREKSTRTSSMIKSRVRLSPRERPRWTYIWNRATKRDWHRRALNVSYWNETCQRYFNVSLFACQWKISERGEI